MPKKNIRGILSQTPFINQSWWKEVNASLKTLKIPESASYDEKNNLISFLFAWIAFASLSEKDQKQFANKKSIEFDNFVKTINQFAEGISDRTAKKFTEELKYLFEKKIVKGAAKKR